MRFYQAGRAAIAAAGFLAVLGGAAASPAFLPDVSTFTLDNGMQVVVIPDRRQPVVTHMVWYKVGSADETPGKSGLAHFLEHLLFKGTAKNPAGRFSQVVSTVGGQENAFTSNDYTGYFQRVTRENLKSMMEFEADRMTGLVLTDDVVKPELNVVLEEQNQRIANNPGAKFAEQLQAALYLNHPYGRPVIGWRHEIEELSRDDALAFYRRFYTPNNAILIIAGDVTADEVKKLAEETYGKVPRVAEVPPRKRPQEPPPIAPRTVTYSDPRVAQPSIQREYLVPSASSAAKGQSEALEMLAHVLGGGQNSRLYRTLVIDKGLAVSAGAWYQGSALDPTRFGIYGSPRPDVTLEQIEAGIDAVIAEVAEKGITDDELDRSRTKLIADTIFAQDSQSTLARWFGVALTTGSTVDDIRSWPDRIRAVKAADVQNAARQWLDKRRSVTGYLLKETGRGEEKRS